MLTENFINVKTLEMLKKNISFRFRNYYQFNTVALANHLEIKSGNKNRMISQVIYLRTHKRGKEYVNRKLSIAGNNKNFLFICAQSLDLANVKDQEKVIQKMKTLLELDIK